MQVDIFIIPIKPLHAKSETSATTEKLVEPQGQH